MTRQMITCEMCDKISFIESGAIKDLPDGWLAINNRIDTNTLVVYSALIKVCSKQCAMYYYFSICHHSNGLWNIDIS